MSEPQHDLFISYAEADRAWVEGYLLDALTQAGVRCHTETAFALGVPRLLEFERAVQESRRTLLVLSPAYLADHLARFAELLAQSYGLDTATWPVIPLILRSTRLPPRLAMLTALDATGESAWPAILARLLQELQRPFPEPQSPPPCPYPGMAAFAEADSARFFGRQAETQELLERLRLHPFVAVIGRSGSGKSSLVFAGLIPALRRSRLFGVGSWRLQSMRPGAAPLVALHSTLAGILDWDTFTLTDDSSDRLLLIVDQFEELFALPGPKALPFQEALLRLSQVRGCFVILTVRADFYPDLMTSPLWREIQAHRFEVLPLEADGLRQAITQPAEDVGVYVEAALVERLVADAGSEPGILPFVQETLVLLWERVERRYLPLRAYEALVLPRKAYGESSRTGLQVAMAKRADAALAELDATDRVTARRIFLRLVQFGEGRADTRRQQPVAALRAAAAPDQFERVLRHLATRRLLTLGGGEGEAVRQADIAHEALIDGWPQLRDWIKDRREAELARRRLEAKAAEWVRLGRGTGGLLDPAELAEAEQWTASTDADDLGSSEELHALLLTSRSAITQAEQERQSAHERERAQTQAIVEAKRQRRATQSRWRRGLGVLVSLFVLAAMAAILSLFPVATGWQELALPGQATGDRNSWIVAVSLTDAERLYLSNQDTGGLFGSSDGGISWTKLGDDRLARLPVNGIAAAQQMLYIATPAGVFISRDAGRTWQSGNVPVTAGSTEATWAVSVHPVNPSWAYVGTADARLWLTTDGGSAWGELPTPQDHHGAFQAIAADAQHNVVVAFGSELWISSDDGRSWRRFELTPAPPAAIAGLTTVGQKGRFFMALNDFGVGLGDLTSSVWSPVADFPAGFAVRSVSALGQARYAGGDGVALCWRFWRWTELNWWRYHFHLMNVPCMKD